MNEKRIPRTEALTVAEDMLSRLAPACERIAIVGSLRRGTPDVGDVELLYVPRLATRPDGLFDTRLVSVADEVIDLVWLKEGLLAKRPSKTGVFAWGESNKLAIHIPTGIKVDLFSCPPEKWWVSLVIRTGGKANNLRLTAGANKLGRSLNAYGRGVTVLGAGEVIPACSEREVFELCGVPYVEPEDRP